MLPRLSRFLSVGNSKRSLRGEWLILQQLPAGFSLCNATVAYNLEQSEDSGVAIVRVEDSSLVRTCRGHPALGSRDDWVHNGI